MPIKQLVELAKRLRDLSPAEFQALERLVETGEEDQTHIPAVAEALWDCIEISKRWEPIDRLRKIT